VLCCVVLSQVVAGRHCLMIDDLCDSGLTLLSVRDKLLEAGAASVKSVVLLDKRARRKVNVGRHSWVGIWVGFWLVQWLVGFRLA
jgi:hypoxanthine-guanine phosphoribosyltransferase